MDKAGPRIEYSSPRVLIDSWWEAMQRAGLYVRFFADTYGSPGARCAPPLIDEPTPFGGRVFLDGKVLAVVAWNLGDPIARSASCVVISVSPRGDLAHWIMIGSGVRRPRIPANDVDRAFLNECIGGFYHFYLINDQFWNEWSHLQMRARYRLGECYLLPTLPEPYFASTIGFGAPWSFAGRVDICVGPSSLPQHHFAVVRARRITRSVQSMLDEFHVVIARSGGRAVDLYGDIC